MGFYNGEGGLGDQLDHINQFTVALQSDDLTIDVARAFFDHLIVKFGYCFEHYLGDDASIIIELPLRLWINQNFTWT